MRIAIFAFAAVLAAGVAAGSWFLAARAEEPVTPTPKHAALIVDNTVGPEKPRCSSCGDARHPTPPLLKTEFDQLIAQYATDPIDDSASLDTLCYYGVQTRDMLKEFGAGALDEDHAAFLRRELSRTYVYLSVRITDDDGVVRVSFDHRKVNIDERNHHAVDAVNNVIPPEISGTMKRVGLYHIWSRF
ncbi:MAG: hypothetical protein H6839_14740 [Planctomycetes bacterium]|nr:hypothetical protein [Planctomycetota bacterium]